MYKSLAEIPIPISADFINSDSIQLTFQSRDHVRNVKKTLTKTIIGLSNDKTVASPLQEVDFVKSGYSPSGQKRAVLRDIKNGTSQTKRYVEIWGGDVLEISLDVSDQHGAFYADEYLSSLAFAPSGLAILYTAEGLPPKSDDPFERFRFRPDFGEGLSGRKRPTIFILQWDPLSYESNKNCSLYKLVDLPDGLYLGQCVFSPELDTLIYATGYELGLDGRLLGVKGCFNRPAGLWKVILDPVDHGLSKEIGCTVGKLTPPEISCRSPQLLAGKESTNLIWLSCVAGGAHISTSILHSRDVSLSNSSGVNLLLVDIVMTPLKNRFPGLYPSYNLPSKCHLMLSSNSPTHIALGSCWGSRTTVLLISLKDGEVKDLTPDDDGNHYSWSVLATDGFLRLVCWRSSPSVPYEILLGELEETGEVSWTSVDKPQLPGPVSRALAGIKTSIIAIPDRRPTETIVIQPPSTHDGILPCVTIPHGGPHGTTTTAFSSSTTALALEGYTLSLPNYTGSTGYGDEFIRALIGKCGTQDVEDCIASVHFLISRGIAESGPGKLFVMGGSHGGFLAAHLIGQHPDVFSAAVMRNPVISAGDTSASDIPDWFYAEFGLPYPILSSPTDIGDIHPKKVTHSLPPPLMSVETFSTLQAASPISYIDSIKVPVLLLIGLADRRVPPSQGIEYYHALKARSGQERNVEMLTFEGESHPLDGVEASEVSFNAGRDWFVKARLDEGKK